MSRPDDCSVDKVGLLMEGELQKRWVKLTDDDLDVIEGERDKLVGRVQERYGIAREKAEKQVEEWRRDVPTRVGKR